MKLTGQRNQCPGCSKYFKSNHSFDKHRTGTFGTEGNLNANRRCKTTEEMLAAGMAINAQNWWVSSLNTMYIDKGEDDEEASN